MRISDWSSDVCSSDLRFRVGFTARDTAALRSASERLAKPDHCDRYRKPTGHAHGRSKVAPSETGHRMTSTAQPGCWPSATPGETLPASRRDTLHSRNYTCRTSRVKGPTCV